MTIYILQQVIASLHIYIYSNAKLLEKHSIFLLKKLQNIYDVVVTYKVTKIKKKWDQNSGASCKVSALNVPA